MRTFGSFCQAGYYQIGSALLPATQAMIRSMLPHSSQTHLASYLYWSDCLANSVLTLTAGSPLRKHAKFWTWGSHTIQAALLSL